MSQERKGEGTAIILGVLLAGAGSMYAGKIGKGFAILLLQLFLVFGLGGLLGGLFAVIMWIWQITEGVKDVKEYNQNLENEDENEVVWACESCGKQFDSKKECLEHERDCGWECDKCGQIFKNKKTAERHEKSCKK